MTDAPNLYRTACRNAASSAEAVQDRLTGPDTDIDRALTALQTAWVSDSPQRRDAEAALLDARNRLRHSFGAAAAEITAAANREPRTVDTSDPREAWKARFSTGRTTPTHWS